MVEDTEAAPAGELYCKVMRSRLQPLSVPLLALVGFLALGAPRAAAAPQEPDEDTPETFEPFFEAVNVEIINIDVWVEDKEGKPVEGLEKQDFLVYRDRGLVEIANFYAVAGGRPVAPDSDPNAPAPALPTIPGLPPSHTELSPEHRLWLIAYVDNYNVHPTERNRILPDLERFLRRGIEAGARVMVVTYNRSLDMRQPFTDQLGEVTTALATIKDDAGLATIRRRDQASTLRQIDEANSATEALLLARLYAEEQMNAVEYTVDALGRLIDTLGGLPGRKALVHVSSGVPMLAGEEMFHAVAAKFGVAQAYSEIPRHDTTRQFESLDRRANAHRVSFYTLDAGGLRGFQFGAAEYGGFVSTNLRSVLDSVVPENLQAPLRLMAQETGGRAIVNRNEMLPALEEVSQDFRTFYSLGISSVDVDSGRYHELEVKLRNPVRGTTVRHRAGYRSKSLPSRVRERLKSALLYAHQENPLDVEVRWGNAEYQESSKNYILPLSLRVPLRDLALLPIGDGRHEARLQLFVGAAGLDGRLSEIESSPFGLRLDGEHVEAAREESLVHSHRIMLERGRQKVGVAILDVFGGQSAIVTGIVQAGRPEAAESP